MKLTLSILLSLLALASSAEIKVVVERNASDNASPSFKFKNVPAPSKADAGGGAKFTLLDGTRDRNGGSLDVLHDGKWPREEDQPAANFFFNQGTDGGRILMDLVEATDVKAINTYSWHAATRGPQVYTVFASDGKAEGFQAEAKKGTDPEKAGWTLITKVDTRPKEGEPGGQYGVSITESEGLLGRFRYLLFDISRTETEDSFGNTFYSEIDVIDGKEHAVVEKTEPPKPRVAKTFEASGGKYHITVDATDAPDLAEWAYAHLGPVVTNWYPKLVEMLPSEGYEAPTNVTIAFRENMRQGIPAMAGGSRISCNIEWFRNNLKGEAVGSVVHEMVHVVQQYNWGRQKPNTTRTPGWITEGIPDYIRWFLYEPETHGADISKRRLANAKYDASYRVTGNFLNWVTEKYSSNIVQVVNAAARQGKYSEEIWKEKTGKTVQELGDEWKKGLEAKLGATDTAADVSTSTKQNALTESEKKAGWKLLFNGEDLNGWHNFKRDTIRPGWQVKDGKLVCADPHDAGDIVTADKFDWFELQLDYNISEGGNSGIMFHVADEGGAAWASGPEIQLEDNAKAADPQRCGWLYGLYKPEIDPKTGKTLDATKPAGEWNHVRVVISPDKCVHEINGVKYFEYVLGSDDFKERVAKSKFGKMPLFAKSNMGRIALQGDHGQVSFRNIKVRPLQTKQEAAQ